jgi:ABC-type Mn2+/Zn2+ transport system permease subunit
MRIGLLCARVFQRCRSVGFLPSDIGAILAVITNRLGQIIGAMLTFFLGLLWFLREIYVATVSRRIGAR